jgi:hypothetical protein
MNQAPQPGGGDARGHSGAMSDTQPGRAASNPPHDRSPRLQGLVPHHTTPHDIAPHDIAPRRASPHPAVTHDTTPDPIPPSTSCRLWFPPLRPRTFARTQDLGARTSGKAAPSSRAPTRDPHEPPRAVKRRHAAHHRSFPRSPPRPRRAQLPHRHDDVGSLLKSAAPPRTSSELSLRAPHPSRDTWPHRPHWTSQQTSSTQSTPPPRGPPLLPNPDLPKRASRSSDPLAQILLSPSGRPPLPSPRLP